MIYYTIKENYSIDNHNNPQQIDSTLNSVIIVGNKAGSTYIGDCLYWSYPEKGLRHFGIDGHHLQTSWFYKSIEPYFDAWAEVGINFYGWKTKPIMKR